MPARTDDPEPRDQPTPGIDGLRRKVRDGVSRLRGLEIGNRLEVEILSQLVDGRKTVSEIVDGVYGIRSTDQGYSSTYSKVSRQIRELESRGLVSRRMLGKEKPYRLTDLAVINLARIGREAKQIRVLSPLDLAFFATTGILGMPLGLQALALVDLSGPTSTVLFGCFCLLLGVSLSRFANALRRVI